MLKVAVFSALAVFVFFFSLPWLRRPRSHGFYRFFGFEALLALLYLNLESWFLDPFSIRQIVSWVVLLIALWLVSQGLYQLVVQGKPKGYIENTTRLVATGIYKYIRHPLYCSYILLGWGTFLKHPTNAESGFAGLILGLVLAHAVMFSMFYTAKAEEKENIEKFGDSYRAYMKATKRFVPRLY